MQYYRIIPPLFFTHLGILSTEILENITVYNRIDDGRISNEL